jgi:hypothetical protein
MTIFRTLLAGLVLVGLTGLAHAQKCGDHKGADKGCGAKGEVCPNGKGLKTCACESACCEKSCGTTKYYKNCYDCVCTTVCLPSRPCRPFKDPSCGCDGKGCKSCDSKCGDGCDSKCDDGCGSKGKGDPCMACRLFRGLIPACCTCQGRVKKRLMVKQVIAAEVPTMKCNPLKGKGDKNGKADLKQQQPTEAVQVPAPPPV